GGGCGWRSSNRTIVIKRVRQTDKKPAKKKTRNTPQNKKTKTRKKIYKNNTTLKNNAKKN
ncbi:hypothetical protein, partial [Erwinia amylovora]|uniref:hypothetical protein n=1 Tax=Erwinia amylovora TaxID=552 RepID=UPI0020C04B29